MIACELRFELPCDPVVSCCIISKICRIFAHENDHYERFPLSAIDFTVLFIPAIQKYLQSYYPSHMNVSQT